jgi:hypothetical protein
LLRDKTLQQGEHEADCIRNTCLKLVMGRFE